MKVVIGIIIVIGVITGVWKVWEYWDRVNKERAASQAEVVSLSEVRYEGLPPQLESSLQKAQAKGPETFKKWIETYRASVKDPRLAAIELDYVVAIAREKPVEAKRIFSQIKNRVPTNAPLYRRIQPLEKNYQ